MNGDDTDDDLDADRILLEESRSTLARQLETIGDIDEKAARLLRINVIVLGLLLTGVSIATTSETGETAGIAVLDFINTFTILGTTFLLASIVMAAITYTSSNLKAGVSSNDVRILMNTDVSDRKQLESIIDGYADWIEYNYTVNSKNSVLGTLTLLFLVFSMIAFSLGVAFAVTGWSMTVLWILGVAAAVIVIYYTGFVHQLKRYSKINL